MLNVHVSGSTAARIVLAAALLVMALFCAPGLLLWPLWPGRVKQLITCFSTWSAALLSPIADLPPDDAREAADGLPIVTPAERAVEVEDILQSATDVRPPT